MTSWNHLKASLLIYLMPRWGMAERAVVGQAGGIFLSFALSSPTHEASPNG